MTKTELYTSLDYVNHSRQKRLEMANLVLDNSHLIAPLMDIVFRVNDPISPKASWVLEFAAKKNLSFIFPHLDLFTSKINSVRLDSSVRPIAKICEYLILAYFSKSRHEVQGVLKEHHLEQITNACFDWLIGDYKVATKAYSMTCLYQLGKKNSWIHPELRLVLEQNYANGSAAYKARARMVLAKLK
ncbi:MAG: adenylosuccinate lyase [Bacteroidota bacterium]